MVCAGWEFRVGPPIPPAISAARFVKVSANFVARNFDVGNEPVYFFSELNVTHKPHVIAFIGPDVICRIYIAVILVHPWIEDKYRLAGHTILVRYRSPWTGSTCVVIFLEHKR